MKKRMVILMVTALFAATVPAMAMDMNHGCVQSHKQMDAQCVKDCELLLRNCSQEVDSIQQKVQKLQSAVQNNSSAYTRDQLTKLTNQLKEAEETLANLEKS